jgi:hypothetical protein
MRTFIYKYESGKDGLTLSLIPVEGGPAIWQNIYPSFHVNTTDGELIEDFTLVEMGSMKSVSDVEGLSTYLKNIGVIQACDIIKME